MGPGGVRRREGTHGVSGDAGRPLLLPLVLVWPAAAFGGFDVLALGQASPTLVGMAMPATTARVLWGCHQCGAEGGKATTMRFGDPRVTRVTRSRRSRRVRHQAGVFGLRWAPSQTFILLRRCLCR